MNALEKSLRNELARTVLAARTLAEEAAVKALHALGVDESDAPGHLDPEGRRLRIRLRAQAKQLGDREAGQKKGYYEIRHLSEKIAYDHWHRLLFARFLAENDLLISPDHGVGVSLSDCEELAPALGLRDGWEVAASFAARMLPQIFRADDPAGNVLFAPEDRAALRKLVTDLPRDVFLAGDSLGWVYQFWQAQRKEEVNKSGNKIGADEIAPVTQLFTEDYMVLFLLHNTLGAWWAGKQKSEVRGQKSEEECRQAVALSRVSWEYLRFIKDATTGEWRPAAGVFDGWPKTAKELRLLDPCMGSGHFVVAELPILVAMRMAEEGLSVADAVEAVLQDNLFGLELDARCTQIAAFNLALAAWKLIGQYRLLSPLNLACCGLGINARKEDWVNLANGDTKLRGGMERLFDLFQKAPDLGSLINPRGIGDLLVAEFHELQPLLEQGLACEETNRDETLAEMGVTARGLAQAAEILADQFTLVATNVPYLGRGKQDDALKAFCEEYHPNSKADLATCFVERCLSFGLSGGSIALVTPQNWWFLGSYREMRSELLTRQSLNLIATLGEEAWQSFGDRGPVASLIAVSIQPPRAEHAMAGIDALPRPSIEGKVEELRTGIIRLLVQAEQHGNPDHRITIAATGSGTLLERYAVAHHGLTTGDSERMQRAFWEAACFDDRWIPFCSSSETHVPFGGRSKMMLWSKGVGPIEELVGARKDGQGAWSHKGVLVRQMRELSSTLYTGEAFDNNNAALVPRDIVHLPAIWRFVSSPEYQSAVRRIDQKVSVTSATLVKVPFDLTHWQKVAAEKCPHGLPKPQSDDPTQWLFNGHPRDSIAPLQVAVARLLGYRWPRQSGSSFPDCPALGPDGLEQFADADGIVCLNAIKGEQPAAERLRALLSAAFGGEWTAARQGELLEAVGYGSKTLEEWLRNGFFEQHCQMFHQRPFIWQVWDGLRDGFSALVNYHPLDRPMLEKLTYTYLGDWIARQKAAVAAGEEGSDAKLAAAQELKAALEKILEGEAPHDIFVRWKPLEKQPIGWDPDLNDGVRMNIRPFMLARDMGKKGAGLLRSKPNIKWEKNRGTDVPSAPWFNVFKGDRINDHHLTLAEKRKVRGA